MIRRLCWCFFVVAGLLSLSNGYSLPGYPGSVRAADRLVGKAALFESVNRRDDAVWEGGSRHLELRRAGVSGNEVVGFARRNAEIVGL